MAAPRREPCKSMRCRNEAVTVTAVPFENSLYEPSDIQLLAVVALTEGGKVRYSTGQGMDQPSIFLKHPPAGVYSIAVKVSNPSGVYTEQMPYRAMVQREGKQPLVMDGIIEGNIDGAECFKMVVDADGSVRMCEAVVNGLDECKPMQRLPTPPVVATCALKTES